MLNGDDIEYLKETLLFLKDLDQADLRSITGSGYKARYRSGEIVLNREECNGLIVIKSGQLRAFFEMEDGRGITLYRLLDGDICILSASCVIKNMAFEVALEVEKDSEVYFIPALVWEKLNAKYNAAKEFTIALMAGRFSEVMWVMEQIVSKSMGQRVAAFLYEQSIREGSQTLAMTHETIAKNLGTAREVVSRTLEHLANDGLLKLARGKIQLTDPQKLEAMSR